MWKLSERRAVGGAPTLLPRPWKSVIVFSARALICCGSMLARALSFSVIVLGGSEVAGANCCTSRISRAARQGFRRWGQPATGSIISGLPP